MAITEPGVEYGCHFGAYNSAQFNELLSSHRSTHDAFIDRSADGFIDRSVNASIAVK